jgi:hypothetical protein
MRDAHMSPHAARFLSRFLIVVVVSLSINRWRSLPLHHEDRAAFPNAASIARGALL